MSNERPGGRNGKNDLNVISSYSNLPVIHLRKSEKTTNYSVE